MIVTTERVVSNFKSKVLIGGNNECWKWAGYTDKDGYGALAWRAQGCRYSCRAHVLALFLATEVQPNGLHTCHSCDNPIYCNPHHLFLGSQLQNMADRNGKQRQAIGNRNGRSKLVESDIIKIRELHIAGMSARSIARMYSVNGKTICDIVNRINWSHIG